MVDRHHTVIDEFHIVVDKLDQADLVYHYHCIGSASIVHTENETQLFRREIERRVTWWLKSMSIQDHSNSATNLTKFDSSGQRMETVV